MEIVPSKSIDLTNYILSLADLAQIKNLPIENLLPNFDPLSSSVISKVDWRSNELEDICSVMVDLSHLPKESEWRTFVLNLMEDKQAAKFVNFYISFTIETLQEALRENYGSDEDLREDWRFYDSLCNYKYLDKRVKKVIEGPYYSEVEEYRWIYE
jgi:hypothetical protein